MLGTDYIKLSYSPAEAAKFLDITEAELENYTKSGQVGVQVQKGRRSYLGGELDVARGMLSGYHTKHVGVLWVGG